MTLSTAVLAVATAAAALATGACARAQPGSDGTTDGATDGSTGDASTDAAGSDAASDAGDVGGPPGAPDFEIAEDTTGAQTRPRVARDATGAFALAWEGADGLGRGIRARCFDAAGLVTGGEIAVNTSLLGDQVAPSVAVSLSSGITLVAWTDGGAATDEVRYKVLMPPAAGCAISSPTDLLLASTTTGDQTQPHVAARAGGGFVAAWRDTSAAVPAVRARLFDDLGSPIGPDFAINATTPGGEIAHPAALEVPGGLLFVWQGPDAAGGGIVSRAFTGAGMALGPDTAINVDATGDALRPAAATNGTASAVAIVWARDPGIGGAPDLAGVSLRRFSATLTATDGGDVPLDTGVDGTCVEGGGGPGAREGCARVTLAAAGTGGGWLAVWPAARDGTADGSGSGLRGRRFDATTFTDAADFPVNTSYAGDQLHPDAIGRPDGSFVIVWTSVDPAALGESDVRARILGP